MIDINAVEIAAKLEISKETSEKAVKALVKKYRELELAKAVAKNIEREIEDLKMSITDGSFTS
jgi:hypothetical protein